MLSKSTTVTCHYVLPTIISYKFDAKKPISKYQHKRSPGGHNGKVRRAFFVGGGHNDRGREDTMVAGGHML